MNASSPLSSSVKARRKTNKFDRRDSNGPLRRKLTGHDSAKPGGFNGSKGAGTGASNFFGGSVLEFDGDDDQNREALKAELGE